jgi:hypothetical protein
MEAGVNEINGNGIVYSADDVEQYKAVRLE